MIRLYILIWERSAVSHVLSGSRPRCDWALWRVWCCWTAGHSAQSYAQTPIRKSTREKARCVCSNRNIIHPQFSGLSSPSPCVTGVCVGAGLHYRSQYTGLTPSVQLLRTHWASLIWTRRETGNLSTPWSYSWCSGQAKDKYDKSIAFLAALFFCYSAMLHTLWNANDAKIFQSRLVDIIKQILKNDFLWWNRLEYLLK